MTSLYPTPPLPPAILNDPTGSQPSLGGNGARPPRERRFMYENEPFDDPGPQYSIREVLGMMTQLFPELANGSWTTLSLPDYDIITFHKVTGEKGLDLALRRRAEALAWIADLLDIAEEPEESDWAWRSALSWEWCANKWQEVIDVRTRA